MTRLKTFFLTFVVMITMAFGQTSCSSSPDDLGTGGTQDVGVDSGGGSPVSEAVQALVGPVGSDNGQKSACTGTHATNPAVVCVDTALGIAAGPGTAASPYKTISQAFAAAKAGDTIQIAQGTYTENPALGSFNSWSSKRLTILGGFQSGTSFATRDQGTYRTLLDNNLSTVGLRLFIGASSNNMTVDGLAIRRGKGLGTAWNNGYGHGGGVYVQWTGTGVLTLSHLEVYDSQTNSIAANSQQGGGLWATTTANGSTTGRVKVEDSHFYNNKAGKGAGVSGQGNVDFYRNRVESNLAQNDHGGGFYVNPSSTGIAFEDNLIKSNTIGVLAGYGWGGGGSFVGGVATLKRNVFTNNSAPSIGSGVFFDDQSTATMQNDLLYKNLCSANGAAIYVDGLGSAGQGSSLTMTNVTVANHVCSGTALHRERYSTVVMKNVILHGNTTDLGSDGTGSISATYSKTSLSGTGNITSDPQFVDATNNDFHLKSTAGHFTTSGWVTDATTSPAIDAGDTASAFANEPSPNGSRINMGFEGNTAEASKSATLDYEDCPGQPYTLSLGVTQNITGNLTTSADDVTSCGSSGGTKDRVYKFTLPSTGGVFHVETDNGTLAVRSTCASGSGEVCGASATFEATTTVYYVVIEGSGTFSLDATYSAVTCGDGFVSSTEECEPPTAFCVPVGQPNQCTSTAPDPDAETCPGKSFSVPSGASVLSTDTTTVNYADDLTGSCSTQTGGQDYVFNLTPAITGTLVAKVGYTAGGALICNGTCDPNCWDAVLYARSTCSSSPSELACSNATFGGESISIPVTSGVPVAVVVDGVNAGWYAQGPFELRLQLSP